MKSGKMKYIIGTIETVAFGLLLMIIVLFVQIYEHIPVRLPTYVQGSSFVRLGGRDFFLFLFCLGMFVYSLLFVLKRFPRLMSYPVRITPGNVDIQMKLSRLMLSVLTLLSMMITLGTMAGLYKSATVGRDYGIMRVVVVLFVLILLDVGVYFILAFKNKGYKSGGSDDKRK